MPRDLPKDITHPTIPCTLIHHSIALQKWKDAHPTYKSLAVGAFVFRLSPNSTETAQTPQLLLLRRAATDSFPNLWEPPGGSVDLEDESILHGLVREVWEETGLRVKNVKKQVWDKDGSGKEGEVSFQGRKGEWWVKLNFLVEAFREKELGKEGAKGGSVEVDYAVALDDKEHQDWGWFTSEEVEGLSFVSGQGMEIVRNAFAAFEEDLGN